MFSQAAEAAQDFLVTATAATTTAATATTTTAAATTVGRAIFTGTGFVHGQRATVPLLAIELLDGIVHAFLGVHRHEGKATGTVGFAVHDDGDFIHLAALAEEFADVGFSGIEGQIAHIHFGIHTVGFLAVNVRYFADWSRESGLRAPPNTEIHLMNCHALNSSGFLARTPLPSSFPDTKQAASCLLHKLG